VLINNWLHGFSDFEPLPDGRAVVDSWFLASTICAVACGRLEELETGQKERCLVMLKAAGLFTQETITRMATDDNAYIGGINRVRNQIDTAMDELNHA